MKHVVIRTESELAQDELGEDINCFYLTNTECLGEFIMKHYKGRISAVHKIPILEWFAYQSHIGLSYCYSECIPLTKLAEDLAVEAAACMSTYCDILSLMKEADE